MEIIINNVAIWRAKINDYYTVKREGIGRPYTDAKGARNIATKPIYRYAKTYTVKDKKAELKFSLFVRTFSSDAEAIEAQLDTIAKTIKPAQARKAITNPTFSEFEYLNQYVEDK